MLWKGLMVTTRSESPAAAAARSSYSTAAQTIPGLGSSVGGGNGGNGGLGFARVDGPGSPTEPAKVGRSVGRGLS